MWQHLQKLGPKGTLAENSFIFRDPVAKSDEKFIFGEIQKKKKNTIHSVLWNTKETIHSVQLYV